MSEITDEAYELVKHGVIGEKSLRTFLFDNAIIFWTANNPDFFKGTTVESAAEHCRAEIGPLRKISGYTQRSAEPEI